MVCNFANCLLIIVHCINNQQILAVTHVHAFIYALSLSPCDNVRVGTLGAHAKLPHSMQWGYNLLYSSSTVCTIGQCVCVSYGMRLCHSNIHTRIYNLHIACMFVYIFHLPVSQFTSKHHLQCFRIRQIVTTL